MCNTGIFRWCFVLKFILTFICYTIFTKHRTTIQLLKENETMEGNNVLANKEVSINSVVQNDK